MTNDDLGANQFTFSGAGLTYDVLPLAGEADVVILPE